MASGAAFNPYSKEVVDALWETINDWAGPGERTDLPPPPVSLQDQYKKIKEAQRLAHLMQLSDRLRKAAKIEGTETPVEAQKVEKAFEANKSVFKQQSTLRE